MQNNSKSLIIYLENTIKQMQMNTQSQISNPTQLILIIVFALFVIGFIITLGFIINLFIDNYRLEKPKNISTNDRKSEKNTKKVTSKENPMIEKLKPFLSGILEKYEKKIVETGKEHLDPIKQQILTEATQQIQSNVTNPIIKKGLLKALPKIIDNLIDKMFDSGMDKAKELVSPSDLNSRPDNAILDNPISQNESLIKTDNKKDILKLRIAGLVRLKKSLPIETLAKLLEVSQDHAEKVLYELVGEGQLQGDLAEKEFKFTNPIDEVIGILNKKIDAF